MCSKWVLQKSASWFEVLGSQQGLFSGLWITQKILNTKDVLLSKRKQRQFLLWEQREKNATALGAERIIWMNDHDDDPRATPSCASFMFKKSHGVMLIAMYLVAL